MATMAAVARASRSALATARRAAGRPGAAGVMPAAAKRALSGGRGAGKGAEEGGDESATTHFGFRDVPKAEKEELVGKVFSNVAEQYDVMNDIMSGTLHRRWKDAFVDDLLPLALNEDNTPVKVIDLAGGTGDIAFRIVEHARALAMDAPLPHVHVVDINQSMLDVGAKRAAERELLPHVDFVQQNAENLEKFDDNTFDAYTIAFGIRNVTNIDKALSEAYRVLKPGGRFQCLEFAHIANPVLQKLYDEYSFKVIPAMGQLVAEDRESYQYLVESIRKFPKQRQFERMIADAGFKCVYHGNMSFGIVAVHTGFKVPGLGEGLAEFTNLMKDA